MAIKKRDLGRVFLWLGLFSKTRQIDEAQVRPISHTTAVSRPIITGWWSM